MAKLICDRCKITEEEHDKLYPWSSIQAFRHEYASFRIMADNRALCGRCYKEEQLKKLFDLMDARDKMLKRIIEHNVHR